MNSEEKIQLAKALLVKAKVNAKKNYYDYVKYTHEDFLELPHIKFITNKIDMLIENRVKMLNGSLNIKNQYLMI